MSEATELLESRKIHGYISFDEWLHFLDGAALSVGFNHRIVKHTGRECWLDYYLDGLTPSRALAEDLSNG